MGTVGPRSCTKRAGVTSLLNSGQCVTRRLRFALTKWAPTGAMSNRPNTQPVARACQGKKGPNRGENEDKLNTPRDVEWTFEPS